MTLLGTWGNPNGLFGGFTMNPDNYHIRRMLKYSGSQTVAGKPPLWEAAKELFATLTVTLVPETGHEDDWHWVPNTNEPGRSFSVKITGTDTDNKVVGSICSDVALLPPADMYYNKSLDNEGNIYNNKGSGLRLYVIDPADPAVRYRLVTYTLDETQSLANRTGDTRYKSEYNTEYFLQATSATPKAGFRVRVNNSALVFTLTQNDTEIACEKFAVEAFGTVRPGDDFLLRFGIDGIVGTAGDGSFLACYDKKLLWRANLYVDERKFEDGTWRVEDAGVILGSRNPQCAWDLFDEAEKALLDNLDWNGINPWLNTEGNDWDLPANGGRGDGRQPEMKAWTQPNTPETTQRKIAFSTPYTSLRVDTNTFSFNDFRNKLIDAPESWLAGYPDTGYVPCLELYNRLYGGIIAGYLVKQGNNIGLECVHFPMQAHGYDGSDHLDTHQTFDNINLLVPGDLVDFGNGEHVVIVENIKYDRGREVKDANIEVIHETTYYGKWYAQKSKYNRTPYYPGGGDEHTPSYSIMKAAFVDKSRTYKRIK